MDALASQRVVVMGLGRFGGGVGAARYCAIQGADVLVTDLLDETVLAASLAKLADLPITYRLGEHRDEDFATADLVIVNPAVDRRNNHYLRIAEKHGAALRLEIGLVVERLRREQIIGVTGTVGKSTTVAMIGHILRRTWGGGRTHVGGNIGGSLLEHIDAIEPNDRVVLELSSFMLEELGDFSPHVAVVTNIGENHLDRHAHFDAYVKAKKTILKHQTAADRAVLGLGVADWRYDTPAVAILVDEPLDVELRVPGRHNRFNAALAVAACEAVGIDHYAARAALADFAGLAHRLQYIAEHAGVRYFNDSKSTTPDSAALAIESFAPRTVHAILGGYDKHSDLSGLARYAAATAAGLYTIGATGPTIAKLAEAVPNHCPVFRCEQLAIALTTVARHAHAGQVVLLSPGCASWDQFDHYEQRGKLFCDGIERLTRR